MRFGRGDGANYSGFGIVNEFFIVYYSWRGITFVLLDLYAFFLESEGVLYQEPSPRYYELNFGFEGR
jgi:hypothetical protein